VRVQECAYCSFRHIYAGWVHFWLAVGLVSAGKWYASRCAKLENMFTSSVLVLLVRRAVWLRTFAHGRRAEGPDSANMSTVLFRRTASLSSSHCRNTQDARYWNCAVYDGQVEGRGAAQGHEPPPALLSIH
jgi:hypothetical protein